MPGWSGKSKGGALGYRFFLVLIRYFGINTTYFFVRIVAVYYLLFASKQSLKYYFRIIHGYGRRQSFKSIYRNYCLLGEVLIDKIAMLSGKKTDFSFTFEGEENLRNLASDGKGAILIGAHMGNWEIAGQLLDRIDIPVNIVMRENEHEQISSLLEKVLKERKLRIIPQKEDYSHLFLIDEALDNNEIIVIHGDRYSEGTNTLSLPFMGKSARFPTGPLYLASKKGVPVSFVYTLKEGKSHYHFYASPGRIFPYPSRIKTRKEEILLMVEAYVDSLEEMVGAYPLQWFNYYPFWDEELKESHHPSIKESIQ